MQGVNVSVWHTTHASITTVCGPGLGRCWRQVGAELMQHVCTNADGGRPGAVGSLVQW